MSTASSAFRVYRPSGALAPFVAFLWACDRYVASHASERVLPTGTADVIFCGDVRDELRGALVGPRSKHAIARSGADTFGTPPLVAAV